MSKGCGCMSDAGIGVFPRVKIYNTGVTTAHIEINGHIMHGVKSIMYSASANGLPEFCFETYGIPDIEIDNASVYLECQPENLAEAVRILRSAIKNDDDMYSAWVASVESWLEQTHEVTRSGLARAFVDWISGDDVPDGHDVEETEDVLP